jgi:uncharacterized protein (TIGR00251 family)
LSLPPYLQQEKSGALLLHLRVQPNASRSEIAGLHGPRLKIRLQSPPQDGKANRELIRFLSKLLKIPKSSLDLIRGQTSRDKTIRLKDITVDQVTSAVEEP